MAETPGTVTISEMTARVCLSLVNFLKVGDLEPGDLQNLAPVKYELKGIVTTLDQRDAEARALVEAAEAKESEDAKPSAVKRPRAATQAAPTKRTTARKQRASTT